MSSKNYLKLEECTMNEEIKLYTTTDVRKLLKIGNKKCLELFHSSDFPSIKIGKSFFVKADCLNEYLSQKRIFKNS